MKQISSGMNNRFLQLSGYVGTFTGAPGTSGFRLGNFYIDDTDPAAPTQYWWDGSAWIAVGGGGAAIPKPLYKWWIDQDNGSVAPGTTGGIDDPFSTLQAAIDTAHLIDVADGYANFHEFILPPGDYTAAGVTNIGAQTWWDNGEPPMQCSIIADFNVSNPNFATRADQVILGEILIWGASYAPGLGMGPPSIVNMEGVTLLFNDVDPVYPYSAIRTLSSTELNLSDCKVIGKIYLASEYQDEPDFDNIQKLEMKDTEVIDEGPAPEPVITNGLPTGLEEGVINIELNIIDSSVIKGSGSLGKANATILLDNNDSGVCQLKIQRSTIKNDSIVTVAGSGSAWAIVARKLRTIEITDSKIEGFRDSEADGSWNEMIVLLMGKEEPVSVEEARIENNYFIDKPAGPGGFLDVAATLVGFRLYGVIHWGENTSNYGDEAPHAAILPVTEVIDTDPTVFNAGIPDISSWNFLHYTTRVFNRRVIKFQENAVTNNPFQEPVVTIPDFDPFSNEIQVRGHGTAHPFMGTSTWETLPYILSSPITGVSNPVVLIPAAADEFSATWKVGAPTIANYESLTLTGIGGGGDQLVRIVMPGAMLFVIPFGVE